MRFCKYCEQDKDFETGHKCRDCHRKQIKEYSAQRRAQYKVLGLKLEAPEQKKARNERYIATHRQEWNEYQKVYAKKKRAEKKALEEAQAIAQIEGGQN